MLFVATLHAVSARNQTSHFNQHLSIKLELNLNFRPFDVLDSTPNSRTLFIVEFRIRGYVEYATEIPIALVAFAYPSVNALFKCTPTVLDKNFGVFAVRSTTIGKPLNLYNFAVQFNR